MERNRNAGLSIIGGKISQSDWTAVFPGCSGSIGAPAVWEVYRRPWRNTSGPRQLYAGKLRGRCINRAAPVSLGLFNKFCRPAVFVAEQCFMNIRSASVLVNYEQTSATLIETNSLSRGSTEGRGDKFSKDWGEKFASEGPTSKRFSLIESFRRF